MLSRTVSSAAWAAVMVASLPLTGQAQDADRAAEPARIRRGYFMVGANFLDLDEFNSHLTRADYPRLSNRALSLGGGLYAVYSNGFMIGGDGHGIIGDDGKTADGKFDISIAGGTGFFTLGYLHAATPRLSIFPMFGLGGGALILEIETTDTPSFGRLLRDPRRSANLSTGGLLLDFSFSTEYLLTKDARRSGDGGFLIGARAGYTLSPTSPGWNLEGNGIEGGPDSDLSGLYFRFLFGSHGGS